MHKTIKKNEKAMVTTIPCKRMCWMISPLYYMLLVVGFNDCLAEGQLPGNSQRLVQLLEKFEKKEHSKYDAIISKKRNEVLVLLRKHLREQTRNGKMDAAAAVRKEIKKIEDALVSNLPKRIKVAKMNYVANDKTVPLKERVYNIDRDEHGGVLKLRFEHDKLVKILNVYKKVHLEFVVADIEYAESSDTALLRYENRILARKKGLEKKEIVKLAFDPWKIRKLENVLVLSLENSGDDGFWIIRGDGENAPALVLGN